MTNPQNPRSALKDVLKELQVLRLRVQQFEQGRAVQLGDIIQKNGAFPFLFPGLGNQYAGMGRGLYHAEPIFRQTVDECAELLLPLLGKDIRTILYPVEEGQQSDKLDLRKMLRRDSAKTELIHQTLYAQPAVFVVELALARTLISRGYQPPALMGYSIGEYVAAHLAGVFTLTDGVRIVARRAELIAELPAGKMVAVGLPASKLATYLTDAISISAINGEKLSVVAGNSAQIEALADQLPAEGIAVYPLPTTHPFHTDHLRPITPAFRQLLGQIPLNPPTLPLISNQTGDWMTTEQATSPDYWVAHSCEPVLFHAGIQTLRQQFNHFVEVGPGGALSSLLVGMGLEATPMMRYDYDPQPDEVVLAKGLSLLAGEKQEVVMPAFSDETTATLYQIWCDLLKLDGFSPNKSFFELGGNSLLATQLIFQVRQKLDMTLRLRQIFEYPTLTEMGELLLGGSGTDSLNSPPPPIPAKTSNKTEISLPNGLTIFCQSKMEAEHFYEDIFEHRAYVRQDISLPKGAVLFDVGGNIGMFTLFAHLECPTATIFTFEPAPPLVEILQANIERFGIRAQLYPCGLSRQAGKAQFTFYPKSAGMSSFYPDFAQEQSALETIIHNQIERGEAELEALMAHKEEYFADRLQGQNFECELRTLSNVIAETGVSTIDLLKIDVQKSELDVLMGITDTDWDKIRQIVIEVHDLDGRLATVSQLLSSKGYNIFTEQERLYAGSEMVNLYAKR